MADTVVGTIAWNDEGDVAWNYGPVSFSYDRDNAKALAAGSVALAAMVASTL